MENHSHYPLKMWDPTYMDLPHSWDLKIEGEPHSQLNSPQELEIENKPHSPEQTSLSRSNWIERVHHSR